MTTSKEYVETQLQAPESWIRPWKSMVDVQLVFLPVGYLEYGGQFDKFSSQFPELKNADIPAEIDMLGRFVAVPSGGVVFLCSIVMQRPDTDLSIKARFMRECMDRLAWYLQLASGGPFKVGMVYNDGELPEDMLADLIVDCLHPIKNLLTLYLF